MNESKFKGAKVLRIDKIPVSVSGDLVPEILAKCRQAPASLELMAESDSQVSGKLNITLILRMTGSHPVSVMQGLRALILSVGSSLSQRGFLFHAFPEDTAASVQLPLPESSKKSGVCFYPREGSPAKSNWYTPGQYRAPGIPPVDLADLLPILSAYPGSLLILQANPTRLYPQELQIIRKLAAELGAKKDNPLARTAAEIYKSYESLSADDSAVWSVSFLGIGSPVFTNDLAAIVSLGNLGASHFSFHMPPASSYLFLGNELLSNISFRQGHEKNFRGKLPPVLSRLTHLCSLTDLAGSFLLPENTGKIDGLQTNRIIHSKEPLPKELTDPDGIYLGQYPKTNQAVYLPVNDLTRHGIFTGKPGSGKTVFALGLLYQLFKHKNHFPFLAFEPAKKEYRSLTRVIPELQIYTPGNQSIAPFQLNIFLPPEGVTQEEYQPVVESIFRLAVTMTHPLDIIFPQVIARCYTRYGWKPDSTRDDKGVRIFGLHEFIREFRKYVREHYSHSPESLRNIETGGIVRLLDLLHQPFFDTNESVDIETLLSRPTVIELDALSNNRQRAVVIGTLLNQIMAYLRQRGTSSSGLRNVILIDEAHLLLDQSEGDIQSDSGTPQSQSLVLEQLQNMTLILRAYGTCLLFGDQSASRLSSAILSNVNLKMMFRMDSLSDRRILREEAKMTQEMTDSMISLPPGQCYMSCDRFSEPFYLVVPNYEEHLHLDKQLPDDRVRQNMKVSLKPPFSQCSLCGKCGRKCSYATRKDALFAARQLMDHPAVRASLEDQSSQYTDLPDFLQNQLPEAVKEIAEKYCIETEDPVRLADCARVQLIREYLLRSECVISEEKLLEEIRRTSPFC